MVEIEQETAPIRSIRYLPEDPQNSTSESLRYRLTGRSHTWRPPTDVYEVEEAVVVRVEISGMKDGDFAIFLENRLLSIRGVRADQAERRAYYQMEIPFGEFSVEVELPVAVVSSEVEAVYSDGFLRVVLPKARPQQISVES
jgi:HSP20 family protein